jgi:hypothetical protein
MLITSSFNSMPTMYPAKFGKRTDMTDMFKEAKAELVKRLSGKKTWMRGARLTLRCS